MSRICMLDGSTYTLEVAAFMSLADNAAGDGVAQKLAKIRFFEYFYHQEVICDNEGNAIPTEAEIALIMSNFILERDSKPSDDFNVR